MKNIIKFYNNILEKLLYITVGLFPIFCLASIFLANIYLQDYSSQPRLQRIIIFGANLTYIFDILMILSSYLVTKKEKLNFFDYIILVITPLLAIGITWAVFVI